jgi:hypothetical protein
LLNDPRDVSVDGGGAVYVADTGNGRLAVYGSDGRYVREIKVPGVVAVEVHPTSRVVYVIARGALKKLSAVNGAVLASQRVAGAMLALDASGEEARLWVSDGKGVRQFIDAGDAFRSRGDPIASRIGSAGRYPAKGIANFEFTHHPATQHLFLGNVYDGNTSRAVKLLRGVRGRISVGPDGYLYTFDRAPRRRKGRKKKWHDYVVRRFTPEMKPATFEGTGTHELYVPATPSGNQAGPSFTVSRKGQIVIQDINRIGKVAVFGLDGTLIRDDVITGLYTQGFHIVRSDSHGAIYMGSAAWRPHELLPAQVEGRLPAEFGRCYAPAIGSLYCVPGFEATPRWHYEHFIGSITKFGPEGGRVKRGVEGEFVLASNHGGYHTAVMQGLEWLRNGFSPHMYRETENANCNCEQGGFDVDHSDRIYIPNAFLGHVEVVDRNNNLITRICRYGNADEGGRGSGVALAWPTCVSAGERYVYISDRLLRKLVRARLTYMTRAEAPVR